MSLENNIYVVVGQYGMNPNKRFGGYHNDEPLCYAVAWYTCTDDAQRMIDALHKQADEFIEWRTRVWTNNARAEWQDLLDSKVETMLDKNYSDGTEYVIWTVRESPE